MATPLNLKEVGTREQHLVELLELWNDTLHLLKTRGWAPTFRYKNVNEAEKELEGAIKQLNFVIGAANGYNEFFYERQIDAPLKPTQDSGSSRTDEGMSQTGGMAML